MEKWLILHRTDILLAEQHFECGEYKKLKMIKLYWYRNTDNLIALSRLTWLNSAL